MALDHEPFGRELRAFLAELDRLLGPGDSNEGQWAAVRGDEVAGPFPDYPTVLGWAYNRWGINAGFMVKRIERAETVHHFSRPV